MSGEITVEEGDVVAVWTGDDGEDVVDVAEMDELADLQAAAEKDAELAKVLAMAAGDEENGAPADVEAVDQTAETLADDESDADSEGVAE